MRPPSSARRSRAGSRGRRCTSTRDTTRWAWAGWTPPPSRIDSGVRLGASFTDAMRQDLVYALRALRRSPGFTLLAASVLAVGIAAATAIGTVYSTVLLKPLPVRDQDNVVVMWGEHHARKF